MDDVTEEIVTRYGLMVGALLARAAFVREEMTTAEPSEGEPLRDEQNHLAHVLHLAGF